MTRPSLLLRVSDSKDAQAWEQFVEIYTPLVSRYARKQGLQDADAADISQDVMQAVAVTMRTFKYDPKRGSFRSWLLTVTHNKLANFFNKRKRHPLGSGETAVHKLLEAQPSLVQAKEWDREYKRRLFEWAASEVRDEFQKTTWQVFELTALENKPAKEVAQIVGMKEGAIYQAKSRVMTRLRERILEVADDCE